MIDEATYDFFGREPPANLKDLDAWRAFRDDTYTHLQRLDEVLEASDREELAKLQARVASLQARVGTVPQAAPIPAIPAAKKAHNPVDETDWGMGIGGREKPIDPADFRDELADLRDRTTEKRARRGS